MIEIIRYNSSYLHQWNEFVRRSKNGVFLFYRQYMDYHADRFQDHSLLFFHKNKLIALLPANCQGRTLVSHAGLTFGGLVTDRHMKIEMMLALLGQMREALVKDGFNRLLYKACPHIYHTMPAEEDICALFHVGARLVRRDVSLCLHPGDQHFMSDRRKRALRKGSQIGFTIQRSYDFSPFMDLLGRLLKTKYHTQPVHTLDEIQMLADRFDSNIKLFTAIQNHELAAGVVIYEHANAAHVQYVATSEYGRKHGALDVLVNHLLEKEYRHKPYFDFGTSNNEDGTGLNSGVVMNKESYGARTIAYDLHELAL